MTIKHIQDQIENYAMQVAREAYILGMNHTKALYSTENGDMPDHDSINDLLSEIVKNKLQGDE